MSKHKKETVIDMPELGKNMKLSISTDKHYQYPQIDCTASVYEAEVCDGYSMQKHAIFKDYYQRVAGKECKRVTAKQIDDIHAQALNILDDIKLNAIEHYER